MNNRLTPVTTAIGVITVTLLVAGGSRLFTTAGVAAAATGGQTVTLGASRLALGQTPAANTTVTIAGGPGCAPGLLSSTTATLTTTGDALFATTQGGPWSSTAQVSLDSNGNGQALVEAGSTSGLQTITATFGGGGGLLGLGGSSCGGAASAQLLVAGVPAAITLAPLNPNRLQVSTPTVEATATATVTDASGKPVAGETVDLVRSSAPSTGILMTDNGDGTYTVSIPPASTTMNEQVVAVDTTAPSQLISAAQTLSSVSSNAACSAAGVTFNPTTLMADGQSSVTASASFVNGSAPAQGEQYQFTGDPGLNITPNGTTTDANGVASALVHAGYAIGTKKVTVTDPNAANSCSGQLTIVNGTPGTQGPGQISRFVYRLYNDVLGRVGEDAGVNYWGNFVASGGSRSSIALGFSASPEYDSRVLNAATGTLPGGDSGIYEKYLGHPGDPDGISYWVGQMQNGMSDETVASQFLSSQEFWQNNGSNNSGWLNGLYQAVLGRAPDSTGENYWLGQIQNGMTLTQVAYQFVTSTEQYTNKVLTYYSAYLHRGANADDVNYWVSVLQSGVHDENVIANFVGSDEYFNGS